MSAPGGTVGGTLLRGAGVVLVVTVLARIAGFVRSLVFGASVGAGEVGTAYASANQLPNVLFEVVAGGALAAVVVPLVAGLVPEQGERTRGGDRAEGERTADQIISALLCWTLLLMLPLTLVLVRFAEPIARILLAGGEGSEPMIVLGGQLLRIFAVQLPLYGIAVILGAYLQARRRFFWPALLPLLSSVVVMAAYRVYALVVPGVVSAATVGPVGTQLLGWGTTAGVLAMALPVVIVAHRAGLRLRPTLRMPTGTARTALALAVSGLGAVGAQQLALALILLLSMRAGGTGTLVVFQYGYAVFMLPFAVLVVPLMTASFPHLSEQRLTGDTWGFARSATSAVRIVAGVAIVGAAVLIAAAPAIEVFFQQLDRAGAAGVGATVAALGLGLVGYAVTMQCTRILSAAVRARDALLVGSIGWVIAAVLVLLLALSSPTRRAAEASTGFGFSIAIGMLCAGIIGISRIGELIEASGQQKALRRIVLVAPLALLGGAVPGYLVSILLLQAGLGLPLIVLIGVLSGSVAAILSGGVLAASSPSQARSALRGARRRLAALLPGARA
ncbi:murein biosynthesis integral membrane protein MurJ [Brachybacterium hainanense]|uniref:Murein biosynthesis integral membrane protein MurJ n=1 Tax=Brachybacterium hainanense TaxID=1541174 RepID=A0ABV6RF81_9MICO